jgi:catechol-2,3-dioxygenase
VSPAAAVIFVSDLARSEKFYCELLELEVSLEQDSALLLTAKSGYCLVLREFEHGVRSSGALGLQYIVWSARDREDLDRCRRILRAWNGHATTSENDRSETVEGHDPDRSPVLVTYPSGPGTALTQLPLRSFAY